MSDESPTASAAPFEERYFRKGLGLREEVRGEVSNEEVTGSGLFGALGRGFKRLFIRLIGLSARKYEARTDSFRP